jgi:uncharacterized cupin superfamily protein
MTPVSDGWFVVNARDAEWWFTEGRGGLCGFENEYGSSPAEFPELGFRLAVLQDGERSLYHAEANQEAFLVLEGECRLLVEGGERALRRWDFFHCPPWTEHAFVGAGDGPCVIVMVGARRSPDVRYPASDVAARYDAGVDQDTSDWRQAYANIEPFRREHPASWSRLPWA